MNDEEKALDFYSMPINIKRIRQYSSKYEINAHYKLIGVTIKKYNGNETVINIPPCIHDLPVTAIEDHAFEGCEKITCVIIPVTVKNIGKYAFFGCKSLTDITIPNSVVGIEENTFLNCTSLTGITIGKGVATIADKVFFGNYSLAEINVAPDNNAYSSQDGVLYDKNKTTLLHYPAGKADVSFTIPDSVIKIEKYSFYECDSLKSIIIGNSITNIGPWAFAYCRTITDITIPNNLIYIDDYAFAHCFGITSVTIPNSVVGIGEWAFDRCTSLTSVTFEGTIPFDGFSSKHPFPNGLRNIFYATDPANGTPGTYTRESDGETWTRQ